MVVAVFGKPADCEAATCFAALRSLVPAPPPGAPAGPFALSLDGAIETLVAQAGMTLGNVGEVDCPWEYPDEQTALRGLLASGPAVRAIQQTGEETARETVLNALAPFKTASGGYLLRNTARYVIANV